MPAYREWCATRFRVTEFLWNTVWPTLPKKKKAQGPSAKVLSLDDTVLPEAHLKTLGLGPKFCFEPTLGPPDILAVARSVTERVPEEERGRCVAEGAGVVNELKERCGRRCKVHSLVDFLTSSSVRCLVADKEGGFVVLHEGTYSEKGMIAVAKNLKKSPGLGIVDRNAALLRKNFVDTQPQLHLRNAIEEWRCGKLGGVEPRVQDRLGMAGLVARSAVQKPFEAVRATRE
ncbi:hypothetical protein HPB50_015559 [Hyalomma asiaticum]|uniref:Uncharacterized protein n=1 Tax=Hyalomma asiaticum TaxID=266040 RepID=A0ACB7TKI4_HYAAI|nr:hypothetical protein HPB50_015559 [Hyalomma asiaticum]